MDWTGYNFYYAKDLDGYDISDAYGVILDEKGIRMNVPSDPRNRHFMLYQAWLADGYTTLSE